MKDLKSVISTANDVFKNEAVDKAYCHASQKETREFNMDNGEFSLLRTLFDNSLSVCVFHNQKMGTASTNKHDDEAIRAVVKDAITSSESGVADDAYDIAPKEAAEVFHVGVYEPDLEKLFERTREIVEVIKKDYPKIQLMNVYTKHEKLHSCYSNTNGTEFETFAGSYEVSIGFAANDGEKTTSLTGFGFSTNSLDKPFIELDGVRAQLADTEAQLNVVPFSGKFEGTVIFKPDCLGQFMHFITQNFVSSGVILDNTSIWRDKIGSKVADERITIEYNPYDERLTSHNRYSSDGFKAEPFYLIKDGILKSFMVSLYVANKTGVERGKNDGSACIITGGSTPLEELIKGVKKGIILGGFSGGSPSTNGEFSGVAKNSFLVEDGKITGAVNELMINGNLAQMLENVVGISKETINDGWGIMPYLAVSGIVISGKE